MQSLFWPLAARAQQRPAPAAGFPNKMLRIVVPFTPGGSNDVVAREIATGLQARLNQTAIVENKPGGGGTIAYTFVAKDRKSTRLNSSHLVISYAVFCLKKKKQTCVCAVSR